MSLESSGQFSQSYLDESIGYRLQDTAIAFIVIQTVFIAIRSWARHLQKTSLLWSDFFAPCSYVFNVAVCACSIAAVQQAGAGRHIQAVDPSVLPLFFKLQYLVIPVLYCVGSAVPKLAILDIYLHIFVDRITRWACYITGAVVALNAIVNIPTTIWQCSPIEYLWDRSIPNGYCNNIPAHFLWASLPNIITDLVMLVLPIPTIWKLQASRHTKVGVLASFLVGSVGLITSILRFVGFLQSYEDATWAAVGLTIWVIIEPGTYLIAACLLTSRSFVLYMLHDSPFSKLARSIIPLSSRSSQRTLYEEEERNRGHKRTKSQSSQSNFDIEGLVPDSGGSFSTYAMSDNPEHRTSPGTIPTGNIRVKQELITELSKSNRGRF